LPLPSSRQRSVESRWLGRLTRLIIRHRRGDKTGSDISRVLGGVRGFKPLTAWLPRLAGSGGAGPGDVGRGCRRRL